jgi:hypothetical protein
VARARPLEISMASQALRASPTRTQWDGPLVRLIREVTGRDVIPFRAARQIFREGQGVTGERERWTGGHRLASYEEWKWMI